jgi:tetratricopeptide (TPR) repeat protein
MAAYRAFRKATRGFGNNLGKPEFVADIERALELDPGFVQAWAELAGAYAFNSRKPDVDREAMLQRAETALAHIEQLAPDSVEHLYAQSYYLYYALDEYEDALALANRAIERNPSDIRLLQLKSWIERRLGLFDQRLDTLERLILLDPLSEERRWSIAYQLHLMHRYDEAWAQLKAPSPESIPPDRHRLRWMAAMLRHRDAGDIETFLRRFRSDLTIDDLVAASSLRTQADYWYLAYLSRDYDTALRIIETMEPYPGWEQTPMTGMAQLSMPVLWAMGDGLRLQAVVTEAQERFERMAADQPDLVSKTIFLQDLAQLALFRGDEAEALAMLQRWEVASLADWTHRMQFREMVCGLYGIMERRSEAVDCLRRGFEEPSQMIPWVTPYQPEYDPIRETPEFKALLTELEARFAPDPA